MYGGSTTSILVNVPGEAASVVTAIDGYQMTKQGRAGAALAVAAVGSFFAGSIGVVGIMLFAAWLADLALHFGPPEYFAMTVTGLALLSRLSGGSVLHARRRTTAPPRARWCHCSPSASPSRRPRRSSSARW
ncbi:MAG: tripartite tricarboxylate transporter permease [Candidatus Rokubacteria bacterium]|nr:tripartite tricarboxylate transporter permease [Candidatus Rokubacteria bacterium]